MYWSKVCVQEYSYFASGLDIHLEQSKYHSPVRKKIGEIWRVIYRFFRLLKANLWLSGKCDLSKYGDWDSIPDDCWNSLQPLCHFAWYWARQCTDTTAFYIAALSIIFFLGFRQCWSRSDRVVNLNTTIRPTLFWRTWTRARASTRPRGLGTWAEFIAIVELRSWLTSRSVASFSPNLSKIQKKGGLIRDFPKAHAPD